MIMPQIAVNNRLGQQPVERSDGRSFDRRGKAAEEDTHDHERQCQFPLGVPERGAGFAPVDSGPVARQLRSNPDRPPSGEEHEQDARADAAHKHLVDADLGHHCAFGQLQILNRPLGDHGVENQRQTRRKEHANGARTRHQPERRFL
jgi:hypothetical protein